MPIALTVVRRSVERRYRAQHGLARPGSGDHRIIRRRDGLAARGLYIQRRQFVRQARDAAKAVYFELDVNLAALAVAREHGLFADLDRSSFERLLPELATLLSAADLKT